MNVDELLRDTLHEQAAGGVSPPPDFADRVLTVRRRRGRRIAAVAAATAAVIAAAVAVPVMSGGGDDVRPASEMNRSDIIGHPSQSPPRDLIAAGDIAVAGYFTRTNVKESATLGVATRVYRLLDQETGRYEKADKWSVVDVAPGMRTAAVLEKRLPAKRIGLLDLVTGEVDRWIPVGHGVAGVAFSPDGGKLVATTYSENPDLLHKVDYDSDGDGKKNDWDVQFGESARTGFYVLDVDSGKGSWSKVAAEADRVNPRQDFAFSHDGKLVYSGLITAPNQQYYDFEGHKTATPAREKYTHWAVEAGLSPDGKRVAGDFAGSDKRSASAILDPLTGRQVTTVRGQQLLAWADDKRLIAWEATPGPGSSEFHNGLALVTIGSDKVVPLSGFRKGVDGAPGRWTPLFARR
ncbi:WD40 repeat domain-containing protein [Streptomyces sp. NPDC008313]|uniref:WD40 repeat domain-containing protein n=1 Tax=Streptomyces sp. NPDC008313 TaxID=3364826 RepID=UPI0036E60F9B